ncbi:Protein CBG17861 [Caenorhabditis briggsae]|uniref:Protein CBG17861 n=1 Tax=Caenorhabditis briggsae TaxID=6238 RepID=H8WH85_CAEBR|nr:Protein CBG17861 [Caenorhabditis briggsae]CCG58633.1 Protein CBG17861 [Caenorhabditis briggsae]
MRIAKQKHKNRFFENFSFSEFPEQSQGFSATFWSKTSDSLKEILRRRNSREEAKGIINCAIARAMKNIRNYHYCTKTGTLFNCKAGETCLHLKWRQLRKFKDICRSNNVDSSHATLQQIMECDEATSHQGPSGSASSR